MRCQQWTWQNKRGLSKSSLGQPAFLWVLGFPNVRLTKFSKVFVKSPNVKTIWKLSSKVSWSVLVVKDDDHSVIVKNKKPSVICP